MKRKLLYILGGIVALFIIIGIVAPEPKKPVVQNIEQSTPTVVTNEIVNQEIAVTKTDTTSRTPITTESNNIDSYKYYSVSSVVDGDTVKINVDGKIETYRLIGMDTPETVDPRKSVQCFGKEASNKAKELLSGKKVRIETDTSQGIYDKYNRLLAYIYRDDGLFYNKYMIEQGYAHEYTYNTPYKYQGDFKNAQKNAQTNQTGLWSPNTCNGDTTTSDTKNISSSSNSTPTTQSGVQFYTSSYNTSKYYYPASCNGWESLSPKYLKGFNSLNELLKEYPSRTKSPSC